MADAMEQEEGFGHQMSGSGSCYFGLSELGSKRKGQQAGYNVSNLVTLTSLGCVNTPICVKQVPFGIIDKLLQEGKF